jgi:hypothetical protein
LKDEIFLKNIEFLDVEIEKKIHSIKKEQKVNRVNSG